MNIEQFERDIKASYKNIESSSLQERIQKLLEHVEQEWNIDAKKLTLHELKIITSTVIDTETLYLHDEVEELLAKKEQIQRRIDKKSHELQTSKHDLFNSIEEALNGAPKQTISKLHQIKLQSIDLFDMLNEMVESAILTALEKNDNDTEDTIEEVIKEITYETINEGPLNSIRIRKILSNIIQTAVDVAEATPNQAGIILKSTLMGTKSGLIKSIYRFKQQLLYMPDEVKAILISDYDNTYDELIHTDAVFTQVLSSISFANSIQTKKIIEEVASSMKYDLEELVHISKETVEVMKDKFSAIKKDAIQRGSKVLKSGRAQEAKRMGIQAWGVARSALENAIKSAKNVIDKKD
ncbi:hypothetical protein [Sulfurimonas sp. HSL-1716]|uniref:hypothetical protein n=1 Tax=Hydrocurvibacter sulfurireducens TaxID=3131937 RepID=UPI0031F8AD29